MIYYQNFLSLPLFPSLTQTRRNIERELNELQAKFSDPETERKLRNKVKKLKALLEDAHEELEHVRESRSNSAALRSLRSQV